MAIISLPGSYLFRKHHFSPETVPRIYCSGKAKVCSLKTLDRTSVQCLPDKILFCRSLTPTHQMQSYFLCYVNIYISYTYYYSYCYCFIVAIVILYYFSYLIFQFLQHCVLTAELLPPPPTTVPVKNRDYENNFI